MTQQEYQYAALAPVMALAGVFAHPMASTLLPLVLFFIFKYRNMDFAKLVALRAADMAFSVQLYLVLVSALLAAYISYFPTPEQDIRFVMSSITFVAVGVLIVSLSVAAIQSFRGKAMNHYLSLKIGERVLGGN